MALGDKILTLIIALLFVQSSVSYTCPGEGRYPNDDTENCDDYYLCDLDSFGDYILFSFTCPDNIFYNPTTQECDTNYKTCSSITTKKPFLNKAAVFPCTSSGKFPDPVFDDCTGYVVCTLEANNTYTVKYEICPAGKTFNPSIQGCRLNYTCPSTTPKESTATSSTSTTSIETTTTTSTTTTTETTTTSTTASLETTTTSTTASPETTTTPTSTADTTVVTPFKCVSKGRYPDPTLENCEGFILCNLTSVGIYEEIHKLCGKGKFFDPSTNNCQLDYVCPTTTTTTSINETTSTTSTSIITSPSTETTASTTTPNTTSIETTTTTTTTPTTTSNTTIVAPFKCVSKGRYPDPTLENCEGFILCNLTSAGIYEEIHKLCGKGKFFDPSTNNCQLDYVCPTTTTTTSINETTSTTSTSIITSPSTETTTVTTTPTTSTISSTAIIFKCTSEGNFEDPLVDDCMGFVLCILKPDGSFREIKSFCDGMAFNPATGRCEIDYVCGEVVTTTTLTTNSPTINTTPPETTSITTPIDGTTIEQPFNCTTEGKFVDPSNEYCDGFILCKILADGSLKQVQKMCLNGKKFNPATSTCQLKYECPSTTTPTEPNTNASSSTVQTTDVSTATPTERDTTASSSTVTTTDVSTAPPFNCISEGRYEDPTVKDCQGFIACSVLADGSYKKKYVLCAEGKKYNPITNRCQLNYECPSLTTHAESTTTAGISSTTTTDVSTTPSLTCYSEGRFEDPTIENCQGFIHCNILADGSYNIRLLLCAEGKMYNPTKKRCQLNYECPYLTTPAESTTTASTSTTTTTPIPTTPTFNCISEGRYEDPTVEDCQGFIACNILTDGSFKMRHVLCANGRKYNPITERCQLNYECPSLTTHPESTTSSTTTTAIPTTPSFNCISEGRFEDPTVEDCQSYIICNLLVDGSYRIRHVMCAEGRKYNPITERCQLTYECPSLTTHAESTTSTTTSTTTTTAIPTTPSFNCISEGRFEDPTVEDCQSYIICNIQADGSYTIRHVLCAEGRKYNPTTKTCQMIYECPLPTTTTTTSTTIAATLPTTPPFVCVAEGRHEDESVENCQGYIICNLLVDGTFKIRHILCAEDRRYNPVTKTCQLSYECPSSSETTTTAKTTTSTTTTPAPTTTTTTTEKTTTSTTTTPAPTTTKTTTTPAPTTTKTTTTPAPTTTKTTTTPLPTTTKTTTTETTTITTTTTPIPTTLSTTVAGPFICTKAGRFPNPTVPDCRGYYLCYPEGGKLTVYEYTCLGITYFNPKMADCDSTYKCV